MKGFPQLRFHGRGGGNSSLPLIKHLGPDEREQVSQMKLKYVRDGRYDLWRLVDKLFYSTSLKEVKQARVLLEEKIQKMKGE